MFSKKSLVTSSPKRSHKRQWNSAINSKKIIANYHPNRIILIK